MPKKKAASAPKNVPAPKKKKAAAPKKKAVPASKKKTVPAPKKAAAKSATPKPAKPKPATRKSPAAPVVEDLGKFFLGDKRASGRLQGLAPGEELDDDDDDASDIDMAEYDAGELEALKQELRGQSFEEGSNVWKVLQVAFCAEEKRFIAYYYDPRMVNATIATIEDCEFSTAEEVQAWIESEGDITSESESDDDESEYDDDESDDDDDAPPKGDDGMPPKLRPKKTTAPPKPTPRPDAGLRSFGRKLSRREIEKAQRNKEYLEAKLVREEVRGELGPGPGTLNRDDIEEYVRRNHKIDGTAPEDYIFKIIAGLDHAGEPTLDYCPHLCDLVDHLADLYPEHRAAILDAPTWYADRGGWRKRIWKAPKIGPRERDCLVPDHVTVREDDGTYIHYVVALLPHFDNLAVSNIKRSHLRGVPVYDP